MAAATLTCAFLASFSSSAAVTRSAVTPSSFTCLSLRPSACRDRRLASTVSRRKLQVRAATMQEKDRKVGVEESLSAKTTLPVGEGANADTAASSSTQGGAVEKWAIRIEQSVNIFLTESVIMLLDRFYHDRHYARFYVLETIARVPYFAFISVLHMYESFGWWRRTDYIKVHFAESWNELHHLLIMEELGGNSSWFDRFLAPLIAFVYYFMTVVMYMLNPRMAYHFSECVERHAYSTYDKFIKAYGEDLKKLPAPEAAIKYYMNEDLYLFDEFQTATVPCSRRPKIENLYDVFLNIRDDEAEHCKTMKACQTHGTLRSPHDLHKFSETDSECVVSEADCEGIVDCVKKSIANE